LYPGSRHVNDPFDAEEWEKKAQSTCNIDQEQGGWPSCKKTRKTRQKTTQLFKRLTIFYFPSFFFFSLSTIEAEFEV
jgi:hypothetical protein